MNKEQNDDSKSRIVLGNFAGPNIPNPYYEFKTALLCALRQHYNLHEPDTNTSPQH